MTSGWLGKDEQSGVPSQQRPDVEPPSHWRLDAIFSTARPHHISMSPDGASIAFVLSSEGTSDICLVPTRGGQIRRLTTDRALAPYWEDSGPVWSPDGTRLAYASGTDTFVVAVAGGPPRKLGEMSPGAWLDDDRLVVVVERGQISRLALVTVADPWPAPFGPTDGDMGRVVPTGDGRVAAVYWPKDDFSRSDVILADPGGEWSTLAGSPDTRSLGPVVHDRTVAYVTESPEWRAVHLVELDGTGHRVLVEDEADFGELAWSASGDRLVATRSHRGQSDLVTVDLEGQVDEVSSGGNWGYPAWSGDEIVAAFDSHDTAPRLVRVTAGATTVIYDGAPLAVSGAPHRAFERVTYRSLDGLEVEGLLFRPESTASPVPAVVYPHGGPTDVYGDDWDGHAQYFVDKGYAWFAINFRGSVTYGRGFERANHDDWGVGDTNDCVAAGRHLQSLEWIAPDRIAIFGASYGSYMALSAAVHPESPFACAVLKYGDSNILTSWAQGDRGGRDDLERMMSRPAENRAAYRAGSPIHEIDRLQVPLFIGHGEQDARVHPDQAEELVEELRRLGKAFEYVTYPEEAHGFLRRPSQLDFYQRLERFLDWHLM